MTKSIHLSVIWFLVTSFEHVIVVHGQDGVAQCSSIYDQCGGIGWTGPTSCCEGNKCVYSTQYYSQCLIDNTQGSQCAPIWGQCGGANHQGPTCCSASKCIYQSQWYSQCVEFTKPDVCFTHSSTGKQCISYSESKFGGELPSDEDNAIAGLLATTDLLCSPTADDFTGKIVLVSRGDCYFHDKVLNAESQGAIAVILHMQTDDNGLVTPIYEYEDQVTIPSVMISKSNADTLRGLTGEVDVVIGSGEVVLNRNSKPLLATTTGKAVVIITAAGSVLMTLFAFVWAKKRIDTDVNGNLFALPGAEDSRNSSAIYKETAFRKPTAKTSVGGKTPSELKRSTESSVRGSLFTIKFSKSTRGDSFFARPFKFSSATSRRTESTLDTYGEDYNELESLELASTGDIT